MDFCGILYAFVFLNTAVNRILILGVDLLKLFLNLLIIS